MKCIKGCKGIVGLDYLKSLDKDKLKEVFDCCNECMVEEEIKYCKENIY